MTEQRNDCELNNCGNLERIKELEDRLKEYANIYTADQAISEAINEERNRCAEIAMKFLNLMDKGFVVSESNLKQAEAVAKAIRQQEDSK